MSTTPPAHDEVEDFRGEPSSNVGASEFNIAVSIPDRIEIRMVEASSLSDYELWFFGCSTFLTLLTGFGVAWLQEAQERVHRVLGVVSLIFLVFFFATLATTLYKRHKIRKKSKTILLRTARVAEVPSGKVDGKS